MSARFAEVAWAPTPLGEISLRRRTEPVLGVEVHEVRLGEEYLMSSLFTVAEVALADLGLAAVRGDGPLGVCVGGLGLAYTAQAALADPRVGDLVVLDALAEVIDWHVRDLLPDTRGLAADPRTRLVQRDFFAAAASADGLDPERVGHRFDAVLLDVDHTPRHVLHPSHGALYTADGLRALARWLTDGGVFALWSDDPPDPDFERELAAVFPTTASHVVDFPNPLTGGSSSNTVYVGSLA